jgi:2-polyprenyl-3-methyl-5-hydroxy-6-metoxy-1,4-benzoquinol methylase
MTDTFWETAGATKNFTHPLDADVLRAHLPDPAARVLDYGCGYGRLTGELAALGYQVEGVDFSRALIERGRREHPELTLLHCAGLPLARPDGYYDAALLFAVLTCIPQDTVQRAVIAELARLVRPGGLLHLSDVPLQRDPRNVRRYAEYAERLGTYGTFRTEDGGTFRHHEPDHLRTLLTDHGFTIAEERVGTVGTLDNHTVERLQLVALRDRAADSGNPRTA